MRSDAFLYWRSASRLRCFTGANRDLFKFMILYLVLAVALVLCSNGAAHADDRVDWSGAYAGVEAGVSQNRTEVKAGGKKKNFSRIGGAFGLFAGYNWQFSRIVAGVEASATYLGGKGKGRHPVLGQFNEGRTWGASLKGRVGLPFGRIMPYLSAGLALNKYEFKNSKVKDKKSMNLGVVVGGGVEFAATQKIRIRADYSLTGIGRHKSTVNGIHSNRVTANQRLMVGISYKF